jgi:site-specific DNA recombinase
MTSTSRRHTVRSARLNFLAPDIVTAIMEGRQPIERTARSPVRVVELPTEWDEQRPVLDITT